MMKTLLQALTLLLSVPVLGYSQTPSSQAAPLSVEKRDSLSDLRLTYRGDTLVYQISTFRMDTDGMLNRLIERLPGIRLQDDGIYVQGKFIDNVLLNGKDFYASDIQTAFRTTPAYMVSTIRVYDDAGSVSQTASRSMEDESWVLDVRLYPQYRRQFKLYTEAAGGPSRYALQTYGIHFTEKHNFSFSADLNNINQRRIASDFITSDRERSRGVEKQGNLDLEYHYEPTSRFTLDVGGHYHFGDVGVNTRKLEETFLRGGNLFEQTLNQQRRKPHVIQGGIALAYRPAPGSYYKLKYFVDYNNEHLRNYSRMASYDDLESVRGLQLHPDSLFTDAPSQLFRDTLIHYLREQAYYKQNHLKQQLAAETHFTIFSRLLALKSNLAFQRNDQNRYDHYGLVFPNNSAARPDFRNRYAWNHGHERRYDFTAEYYLPYASARHHRNGLVVPYYNLDYHRTTLFNPLYRLDRIEGWDLLDGHDIGTLPSTLDSLQLAVDYFNSSDSKAHVIRQSLGFRWTHYFRMRSGTKLVLDGDYPVIFSKKKMIHERYLQYFKVGRKSLLFNPEISLTFLPKRENNDKQKFKLSFRTEGRQPDLRYVINVRDDRDPLNITLGNSDLKNERSYTAGFEYRQRWSGKSATLHARLDYEAVANAVGMSAVYDKQTGVRTFRPENVNGNYAITARLGYNRPLDRAQKWLLGARTGVQLHREVDLNTLSTSPRSEQIKVANWLTSQMFYLNYRPNARWYFRTSFYGEWVRLDDSRTEVERVNTFQLYYNFRITSHLPWNLHFNTSCRVETRYGFNDRSLYGANVLWDADLSRTFLKDRLTVKLQAHDLLNDNRYTYVSFNSRSRIETWTNSLPRYFMLILSYRWTTPKLK